MLRVQSSTDVCLRFGNRGCGYDIIIVWVGLMIGSAMCCLRFCLVCIAGRVHGMPVQV